MSDVFEFHRHFFVALGILFVTLNFTLLNLMTFNLLRLLYLSHLLFILRQMLSISKNTFYMVPSFAGLFLLVCMCAPEISLDVEDRTFSRFLKMYSCICVDRVRTAVTMSGKTEKLYILFPLTRERFLSSLSS